MELSRDSEKRAAIVQNFMIRFPKWQRQMTEYSVELQVIAKDIDKVHKGATIANVTGSSAGIAGGALTIAGLIASPFTLGISLVLTGVGIGVGVAGGFTNIAANVTDAATQKNKQKRVKKILNRYQNLSKIMSDQLAQVHCVIKEWSECSVEDIPKNIVLHTAESVMKSLSVITVVASAVTKNTLKACKSVSGILSGLLIFWDIYSVYKDAKELDCGCKTEIAQRIQMVAKDIEEETLANEKVFIELMKTFKFN
uniref:apolipoprotein L3-like n=1 Tax=Pristiophorus japonicus TaxID=55135 RepID=UPI00398F7503